MEYLKQYVAIMCVIGGSPAMSTIPGWIAQVQVVLRSPITFGYFLGKGFFIIKTADAEVVRQLLLLFPFCSIIGMCIFQRWIPDFDLKVDRGI